MMKLLKYKLLIISFLIFSSCVSDKKVADSTYFGGKIINPKSKQVFFYKGEQLIDSTELTRKNKFLFKFDSLKVGLYTFEHGREVQFVFLEPSDSLLLRLNTWDFDESLVYSGKGAERNNLLINMFLQNEKEDKFMLNYYNLTDSLFELKIDSLLERKKLIYKHYKEEVIENSPLFDEFIHVAINYPLYKMKEAYPYRNKKALNLNEYSHLDPRFYKYRRDINFNDERLQDFYAYYEYIRTYLYHLSYEKQIINEGSDFKVNFIQSIVNNIKIDTLKNRFLNEGMWNVFLDDQISISERKKAQDLFFANCNDVKLTKNIRELVKAVESLKKGTELPILQVFNITNEKVTINDIIKDHNTVIYFWPKKLRQIENLAKRVNYLEKRHPEVMFVGIDAKNIDYNWKSYIKANNFNTINQFRLDNKSNENDWLYIDYSRTILVDKKGIVQNGFTHLSNQEFEYQLQKIKKD